MKTRKFFSVAVVTLSSVSALAQGAHGISPACSKIHAACVAAHFDGKDAFFRCMHPLLNGKKVDGVKYDSKDLDECNSLKRGHEKQKSAKNPPPK